MKRQSRKHAISLAGRTFKRPFRRTILSVELLEQRNLLSTGSCPVGTTGCLDDINAGDGLPDNADNRHGSGLPPIEHLIYVIKENRTYDQVFGSLSQGNGDPNLNLFGDESAPNQRALQTRFVTMDNFYADSEVSADGWNWSVGALANTYVQKAWPQNYGGRSRPYDFEGGNYATSPGTDPTDAFLWNKLSDAGISYRNYGFRVFGGQVANTEPRLAANTDLNFAGFDLTQPDASTNPDFLGGGPTRYEAWLSEFRHYVATDSLPTVEFVRLPNDHTAGALGGAPTPRAYVADNDLAVGKLVDQVSHSKYWPTTAIFVVEDDAQDGPDHVDAHRTTAQLISPYTQTGRVDSTYYSTVAMLHTMETMLGITPMTQFDAAAPIMTNSFAKRPNFTPYTAMVPSQDMSEKNPASGQLTNQVSAADFVKEDLVTPQLLNQMIWQSVKDDTPMPAPHTIFPNRSDNGQDSGDGANKPDVPQGSGITSQGWDLTPAGSQIELVDQVEGTQVWGDRPYGEALSPDGKTLLVSNDGQSTGQTTAQSQSLMVVDLASQQVVQTILYRSPAGLFIGVTFSPDGKHAYASGQAVEPSTGQTEFVIHVYNVDGQQLTEVDPIVLAPATSSFNPAGLTISSDGSKLFVADNLADSLTEVKLNADGVTGTVLAPVKVGHNPYTVTLSRFGDVAYVSNWGESTVSVLDVSGPTPKLVKTISVGTHPNAMALNPRHAELYVANADSDTISVISTITLEVIRTIDLAPFHGAEVGASPDGLTVSPDGKMLYVANATDNDVAVIRLADHHDKVEGLIPTAWFPAGVIVSADGTELYVINAKGLGAGPNPDGPDPYKNPESGPDQYIGSMIVGTVSIIEVPYAEQLQEYTHQVAANDRFPDGGNPEIADQESQGVQDDEAIQPLGADTQQGVVSNPENEQPLGADTQQGVVSNPENESLAALLENGQQLRPLAPVADTPLRLTELAAAELFSSVDAPAGDLLSDHLTWTGSSSSTYTGHKSMPVWQDLDQQDVLDAPLENKGV
jgi:YVTN family beta-propeller protein